LPVAGQLPLKSADFINVPTLQATGSFRVAQLSGEQTLVALPGWQVILKAQDPVGFLCHTSQLANQKTDKAEEVLVIVDREEKEWNDDSYFAVDQSGQLEIQWFPEPPEVTLIGRIILILRPKRFLDEPLSRDVWQIDE
jgi:hypothetical protein